MDRFGEMLYGPDGRPITEVEYERMKNDISVYWVGYDARDRTEVSTIWTGVSDQHPPQIFETIVYARNQQVHRETYVTRADAVDGHRRLVREYLG